MFSSACWGSVLFFRTRQTQFLYSFTKCYSRVFLPSSVTDLLSILKHSYFQKLKDFSKHFLPSGKQPDKIMNYPFKKILVLIGRSGKAVFHLFTLKCNQSALPNSNLLSNSTHHWGQERINSPTYTRAYTYF